LYLLISVVKPERLNKLFIPFLTQFHLFYKSQQTNFPHKYKRSGKFIFFQR